MSATLFKKVDYSLSKLIQDIEHGDIGLPDIQRPFVWSSAQVRDLFDSMYKGFPVGYLLFWSNFNFDNTRQIGVRSKQVNVPRLLIVDGQQRLTSLYAVLRGVSVINQDYQQVQIQIAFNPLERQFEVSDAAIVRNPTYIADISTLWTSNVSSHRIVRQFLERLRTSAKEPLTDELEERISDSIDRLYDLQNYPFTAMEIDATVDEEQVSDIFVRVNSKGAQLNQADFILTLLSVFWDEGRHALEQFSRDARTPPQNGKPSPFNYFLQPDPDQLLRTIVAFGFQRARLRHVYSLLRGKDLDTGAYSIERREQQFELLHQAQTRSLNLDSWHEFLRSIMSGGFRTGELVTSEIGVMYAYAVYLLGKHRFRMEARELRALIARWFFMTALTGRYTGSPETVMDQDLSRLGEAQDAAEYRAILDGVIETQFTNDFWNITLPSNLETPAARSPSSAAYYAALVLLDARVLFSRLKVSQLLDPSLRGKRASLERHHLFPKAYLRTQGYETTREINQIANYALVEWADNGRIQDRAPFEYFPQYAAQFTATELQDMMYWHALPENWHNMSYEEFLAVRRKLIAEVTRAGFEVLKAADR
jgi:hypothetical protein